MTSPNHGSVVRRPLPRCLQTSFGARTFARRIAGTVAAPWRRSDAPKRSAAGHLLVASGDNALRWRVRASRAEWYRRRLSARTARRRRLTRRLVPVQRARCAVLRRRPRALVKARIVTAVRRQEWSARPIPPCHRQPSRNRNDVQWRRRDASHVRPAWPSRSREALASRDSNPGPRFGPCPRSTTSR